MTIVTFPTSILSVKGVAVCVKQQNNMSSTQFLMNSSLYRCLLNSLICVSDWIKTLRETKKGQEIYHNSDIFKLVHTQNWNKDLWKHAWHGHFSTVRETMQNENKIGVTFSQSVNSTLTTSLSQYETSFLCATLLHELPLWLCVLQPSG